MARIGLSITRIGISLRSGRRAPQHGQFHGREARAIVDETHRLGKKVAAHAIGSDGIAAALAPEWTQSSMATANEPEMDEMVKRGSTGVPTIVVGAVRCARRGGNWTKMVDLEKAAFQKAVRGREDRSRTDAGGFDWKELNAAREFQYYADYGMSPMQGDFARNFGGRRIIGLAGKLGTVEAGKGPTSSPSPAIRSKTSPSCSMSSL